MGKIEDFMNAMSDKDASWWPFVSFRPAKDRDISDSVIFQLTPFFGSITGGLLVFVRHYMLKSAFTTATTALFLLGGCVAFFVLFKFTFAHYWNRRAARLRNENAMSDEG